ncbi:MAG: hypothetical protein ABFS56_15950 [Pseudomonadota bacterium]
MITKILAKVLKKNMEKSWLKKASVEKKRTINPYTINKRCVGRTLRFNASMINP